ncbi:hypothetical protein J7M22_18010 [Candidatus Poribacteria bacterium]|nr:hypothetical protein [Candidatus Poribacteria bacterium]
MIRLKDLFVDPPVQFRPIPFWFWNSKMDKAEIERQIRMMAEAGLGGFFMHARFGLETEYMSEEWLDYVRYAVMVAKRLGLKAWLYDEYPFPSGVGGLRVTAKPEHRNKFLDLFEWHLKGGRVELRMSNEGEHADTMKVITAFAIQGGMSDGIEDLRRRITPIEVINETVRADLPEGDWLIVALPVRRLDDPRGNVFGPDYLNPETTRSFLKILDLYAEAVGDEFGKTVPGIFTDEPCLLAWHQNHTCYRVHHDGRIAVWSEKLEERLIERLRPTGYSLEEMAIALFYDLGEEGRMLREVYREEVAELYVDSFFRPYSEWCRAHNLKLTGHLLLEEGLYSNTIFQGDFPRDLSHFDIPGVDHLGIGCEGRYGGWGNLPLMSTNVQGGKLVSSIAHLYGKEAVLSESFGVSGWRLSMADMKRIVDWQFSLGINFLCPHAFYYSLEGFRKTDSPPSQFYQVPYWRHYRAFADYVARLSLMLRSGTHVAKVALLYPLRDLWRHFKCGEQGEGDKLISDFFNFYCQELLRCHYDYDIIPEDFINLRAIEEGKLSAGDERYEAIIIPPVSSISHEIAEALGRFYREGGGVLASEVTEELVEGLRDISDARGKLIILPQGISFAELRYRLREMLRELTEPDIEISVPDDNLRVASGIRYLHRRLDEGEVYFTVNTTAEKVQAEISLPVRGRLEHWDAETGEVSSVPFEVDEGGIRFRWGFEPYESALFVIRRDGGTDDEVRSRIDQRELELIDTLDGEWEFKAEEPNALPLERWEMSIRTSGDWTHYEYTSRFKADYIPRSLLLMLDDIEGRRSFMEGRSLQILINGVQVEGMGFQNHIDPKWKTVQISPFLIKGENELKLVFQHQSWAGEPQILTYPPKLLGDFSLRRGEEEFVISEPRRRMPAGGSWTENGYPFYSGVALYSRWIEVPKEIKLLFVEAEEVADMAEFIVNGRNVAVRPWPPFTARVEDMSGGEILLQIRVINSMANFIESDPKPSGLLGPVRLWGIS